MIPGENTRLKTSPALHQKETSPLAPRPPLHQRRNPRRHRPLRRRPRPCRRHNLLRQPHNRWRLLHPQQRHPEPLHRRGVDASLPQPNLLRQILAGESAYHFHGDLYPEPDQELLDV